MRGEAFFIPPLFSHFVHVGKNPGKLTMLNLTMQFTKVVNLQKFHALANFNLAKLLQCFVMLHCRKLSASFE